MISADDIVKLVRRSLVQIFVSYLAASAILAAFVAYHYSRQGDFIIAFFSVFVCAVVFAIIVVYPGKYIPTRNKHESLLNKYGSIYLSEADKAVSKHGLYKMLRTSWFETYAGELCDKEPTADP